MKQLRSRWSSIARILGPSLLASLAAAQVPGVSREQMWPAPTAEDWAKPCLIEWQRTWEDALAVARASGRAILICVNMDGEIASEHYAGVRYRQPEIATLYEPYVCVIASVYRHTPRDYDEQGRRVLCPRFGGVTCGEHIAIEPGLFAQYFEGDRVAPRHIGIELDGLEMYDVFYAFDTDSIFNALREGIATRERVPLPEVRGEVTPLDLVASRDNRDRAELERIYLESDRVQRRTLIQADIASGSPKQIGMLRLAIFDLDAELNQLARQALTQTTSPAAIDVISEALRVPMGPAEKEALIASLERLGQASPRARTLAVVYRGLDGRSERVDIEGWSTALEENPTAAAPADWTTVESRLRRESEAVRRSPGDAAVQLGIAEASLALAVEPGAWRSMGSHNRSISRFTTLLIEDAQRAALEAERLGASGWRLDSALAMAAYHGGDYPEAHRRAEAAVEDMPAGERGWNAMAALAIFGEARRVAIYDALRGKREWPSQWMTDVHSAYSVLAHHPLGTDYQVTAHYDFLQVVGARGRAPAVLDEGLERFPESPILHDRLRVRILAEKGHEGLEPAYEAMLRKIDAPPSLSWYAGYAALVAAEFHRRAGEDEQALAAYERCIGHFERSLESGAAGRANVDHFAALAIAGRARVAYERGEFESCLEQLLAAFERRPESAGDLDGLGLSAVATANMLKARLQELERADLLARLDAAMARLDPEVLRLPAFERGGPQRGRRGGARPPRGGRQGG